MSHQNPDGNLELDYSQQIVLTLRNKFWSASIDKTQVNFEAGNTRQGQVIPATVQKTEKVFKSQQEAEVYVNQKIVLQRFKEYEIEGQDRAIPSIEIKRKSQQALMNYSSNLRQSSIIQKNLKDVLPSPKGEQAEKEEEDSWLENNLKKFEGIYLCRKVGSKTEFHLIECFNQWVRYSTGTESQESDAVVELEQYKTERQAKKRAWNLKQDLKYQDFTEHQQNFMNTLDDHSIKQMKQGFSWKPQKLTKKERQVNIQKIRDRGRIGNLLDIPGASKKNEEGKDDGRSRSNSRARSESVETDRAASRSPSPMVNQDREQKGGKASVQAEPGVSTANYQLFGAPASKAMDVLLAEKWDDENINPKGWFMSEKLDGMRCFWTGEDMFSRNHVKILFPEFYVQNWPKAQLDGELWIARDTFQPLMRIVKKQQQCPEEEWKKVVYMVYDAPGINKPFKERIKILLEEIPKLNNPYIKVVPHVECQNLDHLQKELDVILSHQGEGIMLRDPESMYQRQRCKDLLKVKVFQDDQATVTGYTVSTKAHDLMGALEVVNDKGITFKIGSGFTDAQRRHPPQQGSRVTFKYQGVSENDKPRFPIFLRVKVKE